MKRAWPWLLGALAAATAGWLANQLGETYISRLPDHRGRWLVAVADEISPRALAVFTRPRHGVLIVVDGLRGDFALSMRSAARLRAAGQCRVTDVGRYTISKPVYAIISTGLEADRTGARNNEHNAPLAAESIWQVARETGLTVSGTSELGWWRALFPLGFTSYQVLPSERDFFTAAPLGDLTLIHALYVDTNGHQHGAASPEYAAAVARVDREIGELLDRVDLSQDLVVLTADHGHTDRGGHGAEQAPVRHVLTCYAGRGVTPVPDGTLGPLDTRTIGPSLALLMGVRFPRNMRAGEDDLDTLWQLATLPGSYLIDRQGAVARFRLANQAALSEWLGGGDGLWSRLYAREGARQLTRWAIIAAALLVGFGLAAWRRRLGWRGALALATWMALTAGASALGYTWVRGTFDFTSINLREPFIHDSLAVCFVVAAVALAMHAMWFRDPRRWLGDQLTLMAVLVVLNVGHLWVYGWPLGFPLPGATMLFFPFIGAVFLLTHAILATLGCLIAAARALATRRR